MQNFSGFGILKKDVFYLVHPQSNKPRTGVELVSVKHGSFFMKITIKVTKCSTLWDKNVQFLNN